MYSMEEYNPRFQIVAGSEPEAYSGNLADVHQGGVLLNFDTEGFIEYDFGR